MKIKAYIDYFNEIKDLPRDQQFSLLAQARDNVLSKTLINPFILIALLFPVTFILLLNYAVYFIWGYSHLLTLVATFIALLVSRVVTNEMTDAILLKNLKEVLENQQQP